MHNFEQIKNATAAVILGKQIDSVEFVMDYLVVNFDYGALNFYTWPAIELDGKEYRYRDFKYRDIIRGFAGCVVSSLDITEEMFYLGLSENRSIYCLLGSDEQEIPEEVEFSSHGVWWII